MLGYGYIRISNSDNSRYEMLHIVTKNSEKSRNIAGNMYRRIIVGKLEVRKSPPPRATNGGQNNPNKLVVNT